MILIQGNEILNTWGSGIENVGRLSNTRIIGNNIKNAGYAGIGGWYDNSLLGNTIADNIIEDSYGLFGYSYIQTAYDSGNIYFKDNTFSNNKFINPKNAQSISASIVMENQATSNLGNKFVTGNNKFTTNDFNTNAFAPVLLPLGVIIDGGGNKCSTIPPIANFQPAIKCVSGLNATNEFKSQNNTNLIPISTLIQAPGLLQSTSVK